MSSSDHEILVEESHANRRSLRKGVIAGAVGLALVGTLGVAVKGQQAQPMSVQDVEGKEERLDVIPSFPACSKSGENCYQTGCCQVSGHTCYTKSYGRAQCNATCTPGVEGFRCGVVGAHSVPVNKTLGQSLYCFAVFTANTGSPKKSSELELLTAQKQHSVSLFACEAHDVFADVDVDIGGEAAIRVDDVFNEFHQIKRKETGTWVNWAIFYQVWVGVRHSGKWRQHDYTIKVDADAVFVPSRLRTWLSAKKGESPHGVYYENCRNVQYGFFGNLEVMSNTATSVLTTYLEDCHAVFAPCANKGCDWKWGPWGEDVFMQRCMDHHYVDKLGGWDMTTDGACEADRPAGEKKNKKWHAKDCSQVTTPASHPYKKPKDYFKCLGEMTGTSYTV